MMKGNFGNPVKLGDLLTIKHGYAFKGEFFGLCGTHIVLTPGNFYDNGGFKNKGEKEKWYSGPIPEEYILSKGDLLIAMTEQAEGLLGSAAFVPENNKYLHNQRLGLIQDHKGADKRFLYYLFNSQFVRQQIRASCSGVKVRHTSPSRIYEVKVDLPPFNLQQIIGSILSAYDDLILNNTRRIQILEEMAQRIYTEWFVHFRFPGHEKAEMVDSDLGKIPNGWEVVRLKNVASVNEENIKKGYAPEFIRYIDIKSVTTGRINQVKYLPTPEAPGRAKRIVRANDIIWATVRPNLKAYALILEPEHNTIVSTGFAVITPKKLPYTYLYSYLTTEHFVEYLANHATGSAYPAVNQEDFNNAIVAVPDDSIVKAFHGLSDPLWLQVNMLTKKNINLRNTRDLLLPKLISGEIDVSEMSDPQEVIAAA